MVEVVPPRFETTSTTFVDVPGGALTIPPSPGQTWLLAVSATLESSSGLYDAPEARYLVDGVERGIGGTEATVPGRPGPWQHVYVVIGTSAPIEVRVQARDALAATTAIDQLHVIAAPIPVSADPLYASSDAVTAVTSPTLTTAATLSVTPASPGTYVLFLLVNATEAPGSSDVDIDWLDPAGMPWGPTYKNPRGSWQSVLVMRRAALTGPTSIVMRASTGGTMAQVQNVRLIGLRADGFGGAFADSIDQTEQMTTSVTPTLAHELRPTLAPANRYVVLGTARIDDDCGNTMLADRGAMFSVDEVVQVTGHVAGNCAAEMSYGFTRVRESAPAVLSVAVYSGNAQTVKHDESGLVVFGLP